jgi:hypothetical protein
MVHGPFPTVSVYFLACAEYECTMTQVLFTQGAPTGPEYQALLAEMQGTITHAVYLSSLFTTAVVDWQSTCVRPLWCCGGTLYWLLPSLTGGDDAHKQHLCSMFRAAVANNPVFAHMVDVDDTCHALDEVACTFFLFFSFLLHIDEF